MPRSTICLNMIVKNEAPVIRRCLDSVRPFIDSWVIVDTGSLDDTPQLVAKVLGGIPGELHHRPWRDFGYNRTEALELARTRSDYLLCIDADEMLRAPDGFVWPDLVQDAYYLHTEYAGTIYSRGALISTRLKWRWSGVIHEYLTSTPAAQFTQLEWPRIVVSHDGARARDPTTYEKDAAILEHALRTETDPLLIARYTFYLAQSYRDCGQKAKAIEAYLRRAELGHWDQEVFCSLYQAARLKEELGHAREEVIALYLRASETAPSRAEALHGASRLYRVAGRNQEGYEIAKRGLALTTPADGLFVEPWIYDYGLLDEYAVVAYWSGHYRDSLDACVKLLSNPACPAEHRARFTANTRFALDKLPRGPNRAGFTPLGHPGGQHQLGPARELYSRPQGDAPKVLLAILAKQKEPMLPLYLQCIEALDYPKSSIVIYIRTNNNKDRTREMLAEWVERVRPDYAAIEMDASDVPERVEAFGVHEWNAERLRVLCKIRNISLRKTLEHGCAFYFTADVDNFIRPCTLKELIALSLPIVAPLLRSVDRNSRYSNYHADIDSNGYFRDCQQYDWILSQEITGIFELPVVHCTYLIRADVISAVGYDDGSGKYDYVIFSDNARRNGIPQYYDNRQLYGYLTLDENRVAAEQAAQLLCDELKHSLG